MKYTSVDSQYIKRKILSTSWKQRGYIDDLIALAKFIHKHPSGFAANLKFHLLKEKYDKDYVALLKEYSVEKYEQEMARRRDERRVWKKEKEQEKQRHVEEQKRLKEDWLKVGGKP